MNDLPRISIVTPSYNQGVFLEAAIQSVLAQNYENTEHLVLDNLSTDETIAILNRYSHVTWKSQADQGQSDALNQGFQQATGEIIGWLNADDRYLPGCFEAVVQFFANHPDVDIVYGDYRWINQADEVLQNRRELEFDLFILKYLHVLYIPTTSTFFRRRIFVEGHLLDCSLKYAMDYDFFLRLALQGYRFAHISQYLADFRWHGGNKSSLGVQQQIAEQEMSLLKHDPVLNQVPEILRPTVRTALQYLARSKRYYLKAIHGYYWNQWQGGSQ